MLYCTIPGNSIVANPKSIVESMLTNRNRWHRSDTALNHPDPKVTLVLTSSTANNETLCSENNQMLWCHCGKLAYKPMIYINGIYEVNIVKLN